MKMLTYIKHLANKLVKDKDNTVVLWQFPNFPLWGWFVFMLTAQFIPSGFLKIGSENLSSAFLFVWSYQETTQGVTYFRRFLGVLVMVTVVVGYFRP